MCSLSNGRTLQRHVNAYIDQCKRESWGPESICAVLRKAGASMAPSTHHGAQPWSPSARAVHDDAQYVHRLLQLRLHLSLRCSARSGTVALINRALHRLVDRKDVR